MTNLELEKKIVYLINTFNKNLFDEVIESSLQLYELNRNISILPNLIGASYAGKNNHDEAVKFYKKALDLNKNNTEILNNLGKSLLSKYLFDEAIEIFSKSLKINNNNFDTYFNLGIAFFNKSDFETCLENYYKAIKINNKFDKIHYNIGLTLSKIGKNKEAINFFLEAIKINPNHIKSLNNLGSLFININNYDLAIYYLKEAIKINSLYANAYNNLGAAYLQKKDLKTALFYFEKAYSLDKNLIISGIQKHFLKRTFCDWSDEKELKLILKRTIETEENVSPWFCLSLEDNVRNHFIRAKKFTEKIKLLKKNNNIYSNSKIKIGYFAADFHQHAGMINMEGIFKNHNKDEFEIIAFYYGDIKKDNTHLRIKKYFDKFFYVNDLDDEEIFNLSIENKIDIAIYRAGLTINARSSIFSHKVAPIQINFLGYPGTTGQEGVDYIISDNYVIPFNHQNYYSENIIFLTNCYYPRDNNRIISKTKFNRQDYNIPDKSFVFCSFNNSYKISRDEFDIWMDLLNSVKNSFLILIESDENIKLNLLKEANKKNINNSRIIFLKKINFQDHLARHSMADLFLDSFNYNAHTSAVDALWAGLPILTKVGSSFSSRICGSLLRYFELNQLIADDKGDYFNKAVELANNHEKLKKIKNKILLAKKSDFYFNTKKYTQNLEKAYKKIHQMRINENKFEDVYIKDTQ